LFLFFVVHKISSHDGKMLATGGTAGLLRIWSIQLLPTVVLRRTQEVRGHSRAITSVAFSLDDKQIVSVGEDGGIFVWSVYGNNAPTHTYGHK
jgi:cilia- and flagella-associated protein 52